MSDPELSAVAAFLGGTALSFLLVIPYIAWSYRGRGQLGLGHALLAFGFLVYALALWTYTLLPVPDTTPQWCAAHAGSGPQLRPFQFVADFRTEHVGDGLRAVLRNPALQQVVFNVALFVPFGMFGRHLFRRGPVTVVLAGFLTSLFIEFTQLTAVWGLFACPYRLFDVDDLLANTAGAALGLLLAPVLRLVPGQRITKAPGEPRKVTTARRLLGMLVDVASVVLLGVLLQVAANAVAIYGLHTNADGLNWLLAYAIPVGALLLVLPLAGNGATLGQRIVLLNPVNRNGDKPAVPQMLLRFAVGSGGYFTLTQFDLTLLAFLLAVVSVVMAWRPRDHRGLSGVVAGLRVVDTRAAAAGTRFNAEDHRKPVEERP
ncbi:VanZ family protein [Actinokineospora sp. NBRC 105648]|uniref:VanZ family protein n=1 Tax=Actinokineospora sp. NBRC 105648 TaxID=3032206 RepID=UPI0024A00FB0|nr:VanZ family protein [Actinokineospora sp. NBRC 105648]GLZ41445.1 hypothetical protein Acsp05_50690 [Actinokineospora sp. NBRC 105648]